MLKEVFQNAGIDGEITHDITRILWDKWIFICGLGGMTAYAKKSIGEILADPSLNQMLQDVVREATMVARAKGIDSFIGMEEKVMNHFHRLPYFSKSSMYYDITHGKRVEVEALNGAVVRFGENLNISTPMNAKISKRLLEL